MTGAIPFCQGTQQAKDNNSIGREQGNTCPNLTPFSPSNCSLVLLIDPTQPEARGQRSPLSENITPATQEEFKDITI